MERIYIIGAGGIGCAVGWTLAARGCAVAFVEADGQKVDWGRRHGVRVDSRPPQAATFMPFSEWQPDPSVLHVLCTKCYNNHEVLERLPRAAPIIPIQNGFDAQVAARSPILEGVASFVSECHPGQTHTRLTRQGRLHLGGRHLDQPPFLEFIRLLSQNPLFQVKWVPDILPYKYTKLMYNAAISPLAAAGGLDNGQLLGIPKARRLFFQLLRENYAILRNAKVSLGKIGPFHPDTVNRILNRMPVATLLAWAFYPSLRGSYCSMSADLPAGKTEIDNYNRHLIDMAGDFPCPLNQRICLLIKRMEKERTQPRLEVLDEIG